MSDWFYSLDGDSKNSTDEAGLKSLISEGKLSGTNLIWSEGMTEWVAVQNSQFSHLLSGDNLYAPPTTNSTTSSSSTAIISEFPPLQKVGTTAKWFIIFSTIFEGLFTFAEHFVNDDMFSNPESAGSAMVVGLGALLLVIVFFVVAILAVVFYCVWIYRVSVNCHQINGGLLQYSPGWAVGWYFIPFAALVMPFLVMRELWQVVNDHSDEKDSDSVVTLWWIFWMGVSVIMAFVAVGVELSSFKGNLPVLLSIGAVAIICKIISAVLICKIISRLTEKISKIIQAKQ